MPFVGPLRLRRVQLRHRRIYPGLSFFDMFLQPFLSLRLFLGWKFNERIRVGLIAVHD